jgi:uncharacterized protein YcaQ
MPPTIPTSDPVATLPWDAVLAWRMRRQHLEQRAPATDLLAVASDLCGLHAQVTSSADLTLWARIDDHTPGTLEHMLWNDRALIKTWAMRGTLHMLPAGEFGEYVALLSHRPDNTTKPAWLRGFRITAEQMTALKETIPQALHGEPLSRTELADAVVRISGDPSLAEHLGHSWGALLKPNASRGELCFAPGEGQRVRFTRPDRWLGEWDRVDPDEGLRAVLRRFLGTYGPVTRDDIARWLGITSAPLALRLLQTLGDELICVSLPDTDAPHWMRAADLDEFREAERSSVVCLLPGFDQYVVNSPRDREAILPQAHRPTIHRPQGWISPVLCIGGAMNGVWKHERKGTAVRIEVAPFSRLTRAQKRDIEAEAARLGAFLDAAPEVTIHEPGSVALY